jgi:hypothetical protein
VTSTLKISSSSKRDSKASVLDSCYTYFLYVFIGLHASVFVGIIGNPSVISFHILSLIPRLGRILVTFYVMLSC